VARNPDWQINVKVISAVVCVSGGNIRQRTFESVQEQNQYFDQHDRSEPKRQIESANKRGYGNCDDANDKETPHNRMKQFYQP
jgi:hypothetical protein